MTDKVTILVGTMTGNAELVAEEIVPLLRDAGFDVETRDMNGLQPDLFISTGLYLICTSTYGQGDVPDNAQDFYQALQQQRPDLAQIRYGIIGLGDSTYGDTYNNGGARFDAILAELGAKRIGARMMHDASSNVLPEDMAVEWLEDWLTLITKSP